MKKKMFDPISSLMKEHNVLLNINLSFNMNILSLKQIEKFHGEDCSL
jgi:hypothetical protein